MKLIPLSENYLKFLLEVRNHESTRKFLENDSVFTIEQCKQWFSTLDSPWYIIIVDNTPVGYIRTNGNEIGCDIHPDYRRKGYARSAYEIYLEDKKQCSLWVFQDNFAINLYRELGFIENGYVKIVRGRKYVKMIYDKKNSKCYVVNFYLGHRRKTIKNFKTDKLCFLKKQIETLKTYKNNLSKIVFNFNIREDDYDYVSEIFKITPKKIQNAEVEINFRKNIGISYGAWSDVFYKHRKNFDYFIFNEDDYFLVEDSWDDYLVTKYNSYKDCGYLCPLIREPHDWNDYRKHAGHSFGIASTKNLNKVWDKYGMLPNNNKQDYDSYEEIQKKFTFVFIELGLNIYDIRDDYRVSFAWTEDDGNDIHRFFWWNEKDLIQPAILIFEDNKGYMYFHGGDGEFLKDHIPTDIEKAKKCNVEKITYFDKSFK